ncbi:unnamed protein product [Vitrella brassicaformis CCMP3155]|uniref:Uncharacterized protein n=1 Tax=Vitrella brassicaformis (strain CCMP3155) TaxID=1169540 RepID=A0A0G4EMA1_VITBC|nr:unnamed protein product [Vitrella brassicaformis CCMP3155]|eukprot:CEL98077.1 unnamed protein product [Vitrella brassicaformis CCMP3155]
MSVEGEPKRPRAQGGDSAAAAAAGGTPSISEGLVRLAERIASLHTHIDQVSREAAGVQQLFNTTVAAQTPFLAAKWVNVFAALSSATDALRGVEDGVKGTIRPIGWAKPPPPADSADGLPPDVCRDVIYPCLPIDEAVCSARPISRAHGSQLVNEAFVQRCIAKHLSRHSLTGLIDVHRTAADTVNAAAPTPAPPTASSSSDAPAAAGGDGPHVSHICYLCRCCYVLEHGGALWCEWPDFIRLADIYKLTPSTGLPLIMSAQWMAAHLPTKADFHTMPLALRQYSTFGHLFNYRGTSLALTKVDEADDGDEAKKEDGEEGDGEGDGLVTRQRYRIRDVYFTTVPLSALPADCPFRDTYDPHNPPIRYHGHFFPSFTAFMKWLVLANWYGREGVDEKQVFYAEVGDGDEPFQPLLTRDIDGHTTIDFIYGERVRLIILRGTEEGDTVAAYLWLTGGSIVLYTTEAEIEGQELYDYPIAMSLAHALLTKNGLAHLIPH